jgi:hypothetical protein
MAPFMLLTGFLQQQQDSNRNIHEGFIMSQSNQFAKQQSLKNQTGSNMPVFLSFFMASIETSKRFFSKS